MNADQPSTPRINKADAIPIPNDAAEAVKRPDYIPVYIPPEDLARVEREDPTVAALWHAQTPRQRRAAKRRVSWPQLNDEGRARLASLVAEEQAHYSALLEEGRGDEVQALVRPPRDPRALAAANRAAQLRQAREDGWPEGIACLARLLILTSLPQKRTKQRQVVRQVRLGDGRKLTVIFTAARKPLLPYGADVNILHFLFDRVDPNLDPGDEPFISWSSAADYFRWWGMDPASYENQRDLRDRWERLAGLVINVAYEDDNNDTDELTEVLFPRLRLPRSISRARQNQKRLPGQEYGVTINARAWQQLGARRVPVPKTLLRATRDDPFLLRVAVWLSYRVHAARSISVVPWPALQDALGSDDRNHRRFRARVRDAVAEIRQWWPELDAEALSHGLRITPGRPLLPSPSPDL